MPIGSPWLSGRSATVSDSLIQLVPGDVVWANFDRVAGREQAGHRPAVVVASDLYLDVVDTLAIIVPVTSRDRAWSNHILLSGDTGLTKQSWAMTEQPQTLSRARLTKVSGRVDDGCLSTIRLYLRDFLDL
jgi:mRNA interferase MazF